VKRLLLFATVVALSLVTSGALLAQSNPQIGTWKLNVAKSNFGGTPAPKNETRTVEAQGDGAKYSFEGVGADGSRIAWSFTTKYDGKDSATSGVGVPGGADTIALKRVNANTYPSTLKKAGKVVGTTRTVVSKDGKITTITQKGTDEHGQPISVTTVWDKQ
jgi:hypothetical protein